METNQTRDSSTMDPNPCDPQTQYFQLQALQTSYPQMGPALNDIGRRGGAGIPNPPILVNPPLMMPNAPAGQENTDASDSSLAANTVRGRRRQRSLVSNSSNRSASSSASGGLKGGKRSQTSDPGTSRNSTSESDFSELPVFARPASLPRRRQLASNPGHGSPTPSELNASSSSNTSSDCSNLSVFLPPQGLPKRVRQRSTSAASSVSSIGRASSVSPTSPCRSNQIPNNESSLEISSQHTRSRVKNPPAHTSTPIRPDCNSSDFNSARLRAGSISEQHLSTEQHSLEDLCTQANFQYYPPSFSTGQNQATAPITTMSPSRQQSTAIDSFQNNGGTPLSTCAPVRAPHFATNVDRPNLSIFGPHNYLPTSQSFPTAHQGYPLNASTNMNFAPHTLNTSPAFHHFHQGYHATRSAQSQISQDCYNQQQSASYTNQTIPGTQQSTANWGNLASSPNLNVAHTTSSQAYTSSGQSLSSSSGITSYLNSAYAGYNTPRHMNRFPNLTGSHANSHAPQTSLGIPSGPQPPPTFRPTYDRPNNFGSFLPCRSQNHAPNEPCNAHCNPVHPLQSLLPQIDMLHFHRPPTSAVYGFRSYSNNGFSSSQQSSSYPFGYGVNSLNHCNPATLAQQPNSYHHNDRGSSSNSSGLPYSLFSHTTSSELSAAPTACAFEESAFPGSSARRQIQFSSRPYPPDVFKQLFRTSGEPNGDTRPQSEPAFASTGFSSGLEPCEQNVRSHSESSASFSWEASALQPNISTNQGVTFHRSPIYGHGSCQTPISVNIPPNDISFSQMDPFQACIARLRENDHNRTQASNSRNVLPQSNQPTSSRKAQCKKPNAPKPPPRKPKNSNNKPARKNNKPPAKKVQATDSDNAESSTSGACSGIASIQWDNSALELDPDDPGFLALELDPDDPGFPVLPPAQVPVSETLDAEGMLSRKFLVCYSCMTKSKASEDQGAVGTAGASARTQDKNCLSRRDLDNTRNGATDTPSSDDSTSNAPQSKMENNSEEATTCGKGKSRGKGKGKGKGKASTKKPDGHPVNTEDLPNTPNIVECDPVQSSHAFIQHWLGRGEERNVNDVSFDASLIEDLLSHDPERHRPVADLMENLDGDGHGQVPQAGQANDHLTAANTSISTETCPSETDLDESQDSIGLRQLFHGDPDRDSCSYKASSDDESLEVYHQQGAWPKITINRLRGQLNGGASNSSTGSSSDVGNDNNSSSGSGSSGEGCSRDPPSSPPSVSFSGTLVRLLEQSVSDQQQGSHTCLGCQRPVQDRYVLHVRDHGYWHADCLRCSSCHTNLSAQTSCYVRDERVFCRTDYNVLFGLSCVKCSLLFKRNQDWMRTAGQHRYHIACFLCKICKRQLGSNERYHLVNGTDIYCTNHYRDLVNGDNADGQNPPKKAKRNRTSYTESQIKYLQERFTIDSNPDGNELEKIASRIGLKKRVVQVWFQNNRARLKKTANNAKGCNQENSNPSTSNGTSGASALPEDFSFEWDHSIDTSMEPQGYSSPTSPPLHMLLPSQGGTAHFSTTYGMGHTLGGGGPMGAQAAGTSSAHNLLQAQNLNGENNGCPSRHDQVSPHDPINLQPNERSPDGSNGAAALNSAAHDSDIASRDQNLLHSHLGQDRPQHRGRMGEELYPEHFYGDNSNGNTPSGLDLHHHQHPHQHYLHAYNMRQDPSSGSNHNLGPVGLYNPSSYMGMPPISPYQPYAGVHPFRHFPSLGHGSSAHLETDQAFNGDTNAGAALNHAFQGDNHSQTANSNGVASHTNSGNNAALGAIGTARQSFNRVSPNLAHFHSEAQVYRNGDVNYSFTSSERSCYTEDQDSP